MLRLNYDLAPSVFFHHCPSAFLFLVVKLFNVAAQVWHLKLGVVIGRSDWSTLAGYALLSEFALSRLDEVFFGKASWSLDLWVL